MIEGLFAPTHLLIILVVCILVFGPKRLPQFGRAIGETLKELRNAKKEIEDLHEK